MAAVSAFLLDRRLEPPPAHAPQYFVLVDRSPRVQAALVFWRSPEGALELVGAAPASTGKPGEYEHFATPTGAFAHSLANPDFRAEGTRNAQGIRGYGERGMRVYDFGWVRATRGWGEGGSSDMRLQMHATDPERLEPLLGRAAASKGCIRIPAALNVFIDRHGILDARTLAGGGRHRAHRASRMGARAQGLTAVNTPACAPPRVPA